MTKENVKATENFRLVIGQEMEKRAQNDPLFAHNFQQEGKNIDDCVTYILNQVKQSGVYGFTDDEIFGMAAHYFDEADIKIGTPVQCHIVTNHHVELTEDEFEAARKEAIEREISAQRSKLTRKRKSSQSSVNERVDTVTQKSLF